MCTTSDFMRLFSCRRLIEAQFKATVLLIVVWHLRIVYIHTCYVQSNPKAGELEMQIDLASIIPRLRGSGQPQQRTLAKYFTSQKFNSSVIIRPALILDKSGHDASHRWHIQSQQTAIRTKNSYQNKSILPENAEIKKSIAKRDNVPRSIGEQAINNSQRIQAPHVDVAFFNQLPGFFANNSIYLQTIRLTTSYEESNDNVHVDLFGFSGDATRRHDDSSEPFCSDVPNNLNQTLLGREGLKDHKLYCQLDLKSEKRQTAHHPTSKGLVKMFFLPLATIDWSQTVGSVIWRCNVTDILSKRQLIQHIDQSLSAGSAVTSNIMVHIWMRHKVRKQRTRLATFQIPLDTGSLGVGSAHIRGGSLAKSYFHQPSVEAGLCVAIYGMKPLKYLRQFVQHHLNVGFGSIVIGLKGPADGADLKQAQGLLQSYIDLGVVLLVHYDTPFTCDRIHGTQVDQMQFYQPCLYHQKGLTKYSATWDIDEFWTPPEYLHVDGRHRRPYFQLGSDKVLAPSGNETTLVSISQAPINASSWSTFPVAARSDPLWQESRYAQSVSIGDTFKAIDRYYVEHGCEVSFCYHMFPSRVVWVRASVTDETRTGSIGRDFEMRKVGYDNIWQKSIVNTNYAHMSGIHTPGSCFFERALNTSLPLSMIAEQFHAYSNREACDPKRFEHDGYGSIHHFVDLIVSRWPFGAEPDDNVTQPDEYVSLYANTVDAQLERNPMKDESLVSTK